MINIAITTKSQIKIKTVLDYFCDYFNTKDITIVSTKNNIETPKQPLDDGGKTACIVRMLNIDHSKYDYIISIENYIDTNFKKDYCIVIIRKKLDSNTIYGISNGIQCQEQIYDKFMKQEFSKIGIKGFDKTYGKFEHENDKSVSANNWMYHLGFPREEQIRIALNHVMKKIEINSETKFYRDFPKKGILFQDILPIFHNPMTFNNLIKIIANEIEDYKFDYIVGLESRGFLLGTALAFILGKGFVPIRKKGKLPGKIYQKSYKKEYGVDTIEMADLPELKNKKILIIDDLIATGGSMHAAINLCKKNNVIDISCLVLKDVKSLRKQYMETINNHQLFIIL